MTTEQNGPIVSLYTGPYCSDLCFITCICGQQEYLGLAITVCDITQRGGRGSRGVSADYGLWGASFACRVPAPFGNDTKFDTYGHRKRIMPHLLFNFSLLFNLLIRTESEVQRGGVKPKQGLTSPNTLSTRALLTSSDSHS